jgi:hypothetical protein
MIWTKTKPFEPNQNNLHLSKSIWTVQNHFGPIEGQSIPVQQIKDCWNKYLEKVGMQYLPRHPALHCKCGHKKV